MPGGAGRIYLPAKGKVVAGQTVPDYLRATVARALVETARQLVRPVKRTRPSYPDRGGVLADLPAEEASDG